MFEGSFVLPNANFDSISSVKPTLVRSHDVVPSNCCFPIGCKCCEDWRCKRNYNIGSSRWRPRWMASVAFGVWLSILFSTEGSTLNREVTASIDTPINLGLNVERTKLKRGLCSCAVEICNGGLWFFLVVLCLSHQTYIMFLNVFLRTVPPAHDPCLLECERKTQTSSAAFAFLYETYIHIIYIL